MKHEAVRIRLAAGDLLRMQFVEGRRIWWFENPRADVPDAVAQKLHVDGNVTELGDSLFGLAGNSQSWGAGRV